MVSDTITIYMSKVVIVDDDPLFLQSISQILKDEGYDVESFESVQFTRTYQEVMPDVLLVDICFGDDNDGLKLSQALANHRELHHVPLILISSDSKVAQYAEQVKAKDYLVKPFPITKMLEKVALYS
jgi:two-component system response regulator VicR